MSEFNEDIPHLCTLEEGEMGNEAFCKLVIKTLTKDLDDPPQCDDCYDMAISTLVDSYLEDANGLNDREAAAVIRRGLLNISGIAGRAHEHGRDVINVEMSYPFAIAITQLAALGWVACNKTNDLKWSNEDAE